MKCICVKRKCRHEEENELKGVPCGPLCLRLGLVVQEIPSSRAVENFFFWDKGIHPIIKRTVKQSKGALVCIIDRFGHYWAIV